MLKNLGYYGTYHDENISVSVLLENPLRCGIESSKLAFSVMVRDKQDNAKPFGFQDCTFYIMDEQNSLYNTEKIFGVPPTIEAVAVEDESIRRPDGLIVADFRPEFLFQDLRIVFYCKPCERFCVIKLKF